MPSTSIGEGANEAVKSGASRNSVPGRPRVVVQEALDLGPHRIVTAASLADQGFTVRCLGLQRRFEDGADLPPTLRTHASASPTRLSKPRAGNGSAAPSRNRAGPGSTSIIGEGYRPGKQDLPKCAAAPAGRTGRGGLRVRPRAQDPESPASRILS